MKERLPSSARLRDVLAGQDAQRLLQRLDLLLALGCALLVRHARLDAARLELLVVREGRVELRLRGLRSKARIEEY